MNKETLGRCGNCGGSVTVDTIYWSVVPPKPKCESCGAYAKETGPVIEMESSSRKPYITTNGTGHDWIENYLQLTSKGK